MFIETCLKDTKQTNFPVVMAVAIDWILIGSLLPEISSLFLISKDWVCFKNKSPRFRVEMYYLCLDISVQGENPPWIEFIISVYFVNVLLRTLFYVAHDIANYFESLATRNWNKNVIDGITLS